MYFEKNGFVVCRKTEMDFLTDTEDIKDIEDYNSFSDDINDAKVFLTLEEAKSFIEEKLGDKDSFEVLKYEKTIFISRDFEDIDIERDWESDSDESFETRYIIKGSEGTD